MTVQGEPASSVLLGKGAGGLLPSSRALPPTWSDVRTWATRSAAGQERERGSRATVRRMINILARGHPRAARSEIREMESGEARGRRVYRHVDFLMRERKRERERSTD